MLVCLRVRLRFPSYLASMRVPVPFRFYPDCLRNMNTHVVVFCDRQLVIAMFALVFIRRIPIPIVQTLLFQDQLLGARTRLNLEAV